MNNMASESSSSSSSGRRGERILTIYIYLFFIFKITGSFVDEAGSRGLAKLSGHLNGEKNTFIYDKMREKEKGTEYKAVAQCCLP